MNKDIMKAFGFAEEVAKVDLGMCPFCNEIVKEEDFRNEISKKEFQISGLCQKCQDKMFGAD